VVGVRQPRFGQLGDLHVALHE
jgi:hypothetical protein